MLIEQFHYEFVTIFEQISFATWCCWITFLCIQFIISWIESLNCIALHVENNLIEQWTLYHWNALVRLFYSLCFFFPLFCVATSQIDLRWLTKWLSCYTRFNCFRYLPHCIFVQVILEIVEKSDNTNILLEWIWTTEISIVREREKNVG